MKKMKKIQGHPYFTPEEEIRRVWDIEEIKDLMSRRAYYMANDLRREELNDLWVTEEAHRITASFGSNWGYYTGMNEISYFYVVRHSEKRKEELKKYSSVHPEVKNCEENLGYGTMIWRPINTPYVVLAADGKTAKGMWYTIGQESLGTDGEAAECRWYNGRFAVDFAKENGVWKIWHLVEANDLCLGAGEDGNELPTRPQPGTVYPENEFGEPTVKMLTHNGILNWSDNYPPLPAEYASFSDEVSYGPEGHPDYDG